MDTQLEERMKRDLFNVTRAVEAPVGFAHEALRLGRQRRRRRTGTLIACGAVAAFTGAMLVPALGSEGGRRIASDPASKVPSAQLEWARSLPQGPMPALPMWTDDGLRDGETRVVVDGRVDTARPAQRVVGGWLVMLRTDAPELAPAVLSADGALRPLAPYPDEVNGGTGVAFVSPDGREVAYGNRVVDVVTDDLTDIPHDPLLLERPSLKYANSLVIAGWSDEGLVYSGVPTSEGMGTEWLLRPDGSTVRLGAPGSDVRSSAGGTAGLAMTYDYGEKQNTCTTSYALRDAKWLKGATGCLGRYLGESLDLSPDGRWLLTDDLPELWDVQNGEWTSFDAPGDVLADDHFEWLGAAGWESDDALLIPLNDGETAGKQTIQVVRCTVSTGACEKAGTKVQLTLAPDADPMFGPAPVISFGNY
ncbi:hypothetical protein [Nocardioides sp. InS609-2]|uniref:hypothetical protein n=1 Tax=Nocardioides sp. InS609-2 TaxID=2760705 RepID=UPI0020BFF65E|nr:hypothetical protein [Nocardioides sp. InS609-2]